MVLQTTEACESAQTFELTFSKKNTSRFMVGIFLATNTVLTYTGSKPSTWLHETRFCSFQNLKLEKKTCKEVTCFAPSLSQGDLSRQTELLVSSRKTSCLHGWSSSLLVKLQDAIRFTYLLDRGYWARKPEQTKYLRCRFLIENNQWFLLVQKSQTKSFSPFLFGRYVGQRN